MVSVCTVPARGGRSCEHFGGYKTINRIPFISLPFEKNDLVTTQKLKASLFVPKIIPLESMIKSDY